MRTKNRKNQNQEASYKNNPNKSGESLIVGRWKGIVFVFIDIDEEKIESSFVYSAFFFSLGSEIFDNTPEIGLKTFSSLASILA